MMITSDIGIYTKGPVFCVDFFVPPAARRTGRLATGVMIGHRSLFNNKCPLYESFGRTGGIGCLLGFERF
jgi:hypothetical protein